jgi:NAD(P)-dependent dehydrogenase (short-subunit alcohol dehydrogenase family)
MSSLLDGKTAVVTGASRGIGRAISLQFANHGADVVVADIQEQPALAERPTHIAIEESTDASSAFVETDATEKSDIVTAVEAADDFGGLDVMVNNVGQSERDFDFVDLPEEEYDRIMDLNLRSCFLGSQVAAQEMRSGGGGCIINLSSVDGIRGESAVPIYSAGKGGVRLLTYALAGRFGTDGIRVNAIHPGLVKTDPVTDDDGNLREDLIEKFLPQTALERAAEPTEIGKAATFLASDLASYVTGSSLVVDGGFTNTNL